MAFLRDLYWPSSFSTFVYTNCLQSPISKKSLMLTTRDTLLIRKMQEVGKGKCKKLEKNLTQNMTTTFSAYLQTWRLKPSHAKMVTVAFHLYNRQPSMSIWYITPVTYHPSAQSKLSWSQIEQKPHIQSSVEKVPPLSPNTSRRNKEDYVQDFEKAGV